MSTARALLIALCCVAATAIGGSTRPSTSSSPPPQAHFSFGSIPLNKGRPLSDRSSTRSHWWPVWCIVSVVIVVLASLVVGLLLFCAVRHVKRRRAERSSQRRAASYPQRWLRRQPDERTAREIREYRAAAAAASPLPPADLLREGSERSRSVPAQGWSVMDETQMQHDMSDYEDADGERRSHPLQQHRRNVLVSSRQRQYDESLTTATAAPGASSGSLVASAAPRAHSDTAIMQTSALPDVTRSASVTMSLRSLSLEDISVGKHNGDAM